MTSPVPVRQTGPADQAAIEALYPDAFPDEDLLRLVRALLARSSDVLSLVATNDDALVGHAVFTRCRLVGTDTQPWLLGPLGVVSAHQGRGVGTALVRDGHARLQALGATHVLVFGDTNYYGRFGFQPRSRVAPPHPIPEKWQAAWQELAFGGAAPLEGVLQTPEPWQDRALWSD